MIMAEEEVVTVKTLADAVTPAVAEEITGVVVAEEITEAVVVEEITEAAAEETKEMMAVILRKDIKYSCTDYSNYTN